MSTDTARAPRTSLPRAGQPLISTRPANYLTKIGAQWYIRSEMTLYDQPALSANYYKIIATGCNPYGWTPTLEELTEFGPYKVEDRGQGWYCATKGSGRLSLQIGYSTTAEFIDDWPIPCPKVRAGIETRWKKAAGGYWEKYLKTKGWVPA